MSAPHGNGDHAAGAAVHGCQNHPDLSQTRFRGNAQAHCASCAGGHRIGWVGHGNAVQFCAGTDHRRHFNLVRQLAARFRGLAPVLAGGVVLGSRLRAYQHSDPCGRAAHQCLLSGARTGQAAMAWHGSRTARDNESGQGCAVQPQRLLGSASAVGFPGDGNNYLDA